MTPPEIIRLDNHLFETHYECKQVLNGFYDAIITDPPYGIRAGARKSGMCVCYPCFCIILLINVVVVWVVYG